MYSVEDRLNGQPDIEKKKAFEDVIEKFRPAYLRIVARTFKNISAWNQYTLPSNEYTLPSNQFTFPPNQYALPYAEDRKLDVAGSPSSFGQGNLKFKRGLSGTIDGFKVSALADTGAGQNAVSSNFASAQKLDVARSSSSFRQGNSTLAHSLGTSKY